MPAVHHRYATVAGHRLFFREAGDLGAPALVLLHGFPTSSYMFRDLIPALADRYHVIAPDHLGFGLSDAPPVEEFDYTFDALTDLTAGLLRELGIARYAVYVQDYGAPIGWRLALRDPSAITAIITQNGNGYDAGFVESFWKVVWAYQSEQTPDTEAAVRQFLTLDATRWQYVTGVADETLVDPESWYHDYALISRARQRRGATQAVARLRHQRAAIPSPARVLPRHPGAAAGGVGPRRRDLRPGRRRSVRRRLTRRRDPPARRRALRARVRAGRSHRVDPRLPDQGPPARLT